MNGQAELGNLSGWSFLKAAINTTVDGRHFKLEPTAYIQQEVPTVLFAKPSESYLIIVKYKRLASKDPLNSLTDAFTNIRFRYESGKEDVITVPLGGYQTDWQETQLYYSLMQDEVLTNILFGVNTKDCVGGMLLDNLQLRPSDVIIETGEPVQDNYEKFRELSILYGLEANLPELG
jgi:hypothetical protein